MTRSSRVATLASARASCVGALNSRNSSSQHSIEMATSRSQPFRGDRDAPWSAISCTLIRRRLN